MMHRRNALVGLGSAAAAGTANGHAQTSRLLIIGFLNSGSSAAFADLQAGYLAGLAEAGLADGRNCRIEYRWAEGDYTRLPTLAAELVRMGVDVLVAGGGTPAARAARAATATIPIVFIASDPVALGLVETLARPGGNATGMSLLNPDLAPKRVQLLAELVPAAHRLALLTNPNNPEAHHNVPVFAAAARALSRTLDIFDADAPAKIDVAFAAMATARSEALIVNNDPFFMVNRERVIAHASRLRLPAIYDLREFVVSGGLASYGSSIVDSYRRLGHYTARVLAGTKPADLPVWQPTHYSLALNMKAAAGLGLEIPATILVRADEVIE